GSRPASWPPPRLAGRVGRGTSSLQRPLDKVEVAVLVLEHVRDRGPDRPRRPVGPADGAVEVLLAQLRENLTQLGARLLQLLFQALDRPVAGLLDLGLVELV